MRLIYFDTETTGLDPSTDSIIELALIIIEDKKVIEEYDEFIKIDTVLDEDIEELTGITNQMLQEEGLSEERVATDLMHRLQKNTIMIAHNAQFDLNFIYQLLCKYYPVQTVKVVLRRMKWLDTLTILKDRKGYPHKLKDMVEYYNLGDFQFHRAIDDTRVLPLAVGKMYGERGDILEYLNIFGYNPKYGITGEQFDFITYIPQDYHNNIVGKDKILPKKKIKK